MIGAKSVRTLPTNRSTRPKRLPRAVVAATHYVLALAVLFGILHSGGRYFYCDAFGLLASDPCAEAATDNHSKSPLGMLSEHHADCCEILTLAAMPQAAQAVAPSVAPAARVATVPALWLASQNDSVAPSPVDRTLVRWRPPPRASNDRCAQLMVFLI